MEQRINALRQEIGRIRALAATCAPNLRAEFLELASAMQTLVEELAVLLNKEPVR